jgi:hypothetical protein
MGTERVIECVNNDAERGRRLTMLLTRRKVLTWTTYCFGLTCHENDLPHSQYITPAVHIHSPIFSHHSLPQSQALHLHFSFLIQLSVLPTPQLEPKSTSPHAAKMQIATLILLLPALAAAFPFPISMLFPTSPLPHLIKQTPTNDTRPSLPRHSLSGSPHRGHSRCGRFHQWL